MLLSAESHPPEAWKNTPLASNLVAHPVRQGGLRAAAWAPPLQERASELMPVAHWDQQQIIQFFLDILLELGINGIKITKF